MKPKLEFQRTIMDQLQSFHYVLVDPIKSKEAVDSMDILFRYEDVNSLTPKLQDISGLNNISMTSSLYLTKSIIKLRDNVEMIVNLIHKFTHKSMVYLDEVEVFQRRVKTSNGIYIPCIEHLFEQQVLKSFMNMKGINKATFQYFNDCHILVQEDLLDYFNIKYGTRFSSLYHLTDFDEVQRVRMIKHLKSLQSNGFMKTIKHRFMGFLRQAKTI